MAHGELRMTKAEMQEGLAAGRILIQEEWSHPLEKQWIEELIKEGMAAATPWQYKDNFQYEMRRITGIRK